MTRILGIETSCDETSAAVLEGESDGQHEQLSRLHEEVGYEQRAPELGHVERVGQCEQETGDGRCDCEHYEDRVADQVGDAQHVVTQHKRARGNDLTAAGQLVAATSGIAFS